MTMPFQAVRRLADDARARALELVKALSNAAVGYSGFRDSGSPFQEQGAPGRRSDTRLTTAAVRW